MTLSSLWKEQKSQLEGKHVRQIISFAGDGKLRDDNQTSKEFRDFLSQIPSSQLKQYLDECITDKFDDSGFVLQDIVNQIGTRLGFSVTYGRYRGIHGEVGFDGAWEFPDEHVVIVEVKTTDAYQINLETIAKYRREIIKQGKATEENSSILIILGRQERDTSNLEAQIRGSRFAWNIRIISVDALARLMLLKEEIDDPRIIKNISAILIPREYTKLDGIIDLVFSTAEDIKEENIIEEDIGTKDQDSEKKEKPVSFHAACKKRIEDHIQQNLIRHSRTTYSTPDDETRVSCAVSKEYEKGGQTYYWFAFHPHQKEFLEGANDSYVAFGCGSENTLLYIPLAKFSNWLSDSYTTENENRFYWHVIINKDNEGLSLYLKKGTPDVPLDSFLL